MRFGFHTHAALIVAATQLAAVPAVHALTWSHEFTVELHTLDYPGSRSGYAQRLDYSYFLKPIEHDSAPYAEEAFVTQASWISASVHGGEVETTGGPNYRSEYALNGRMMIPGSMQFGEIEYARRAAWTNPYALSGNDSDELITKYFRLTAGMYITPGAAIDLSYSQSTSENKPKDDVTVRAFGAHGHTLFPVNEQVQLAFDLALVRSAADLENKDFSSFDYDLTVTGFYNRGIGGGLNLTKGFEPGYPLADYSGWKIFGSWYIQPDLPVTAAWQTNTWWDDHKETTITIGFGLRL